MMLIMMMVTMMTTRIVRCDRCDKGRVVLRQGHAGHYFYFIFSGSVFIQIDLYDARTGQTTPSTENIIRTGESFGVRCCFFHS